MAIGLAVVYYDRAARTLGQMLNVGTEVSDIGRCVHFRCKWNGIIYVT